MNECFGTHFIKNGEILPVKFFDNSLLYEGDSVYEVLRMIKGNPVFFRDHIERLRKSVQIQNHKMIADTDILRNDIIKLSGTDSLTEANLKIVFNYNSGSINYIIFFTEPTYPTQKQYDDGVRGILFNAVRTDPESKVINHKLRSEIYHRLIHEGAYEALLVDNKNFITEGSRSNIFFIKGETLYTAPEKVILSGITRKYILKICDEQSIKVVFESVRAGRIGDFDSVFMSGTSPIVLPFRWIENHEFNVGLPIMEQLRRMFIEKSEESIREFRSE